MIIKATSGKINHTNGGARVTREGMNAISDILIANMEPLGLPKIMCGMLISSVSDHMVTIEGDTQGKLTKRIAKFTAQHFDHKLPPEVVSEIGNIANANLVKGTLFDITDVFDWDDGDFRDSGSCFWGSNAMARDMIASVGGLAIRVWDSRHTNVGISRAWILQEAKFLVVFNAYGVVSLSQYGALLGDYLGLPYREIRMTNDGCDGGDLYINRGIAYIVGTSRYDSYDPNICTVKGEYYWSCHSCLTCYHCGLDEIDERSDDYRVVDGEIYCNDCFRDNVYTCQYCGDLRMKTDRPENVPDDLRSDICLDCLSHMVKCVFCDRNIVSGQNTSIYDHDTGLKVGYGCSRCSQAESGYKLCRICNHRYSAEGMTTYHDLTRDRGYPACGICTSKYTIMCDTCGRLVKYRGEQTHSTCADCRHISEMDQVREEIGYKVGDLVKISDNRCACAKWIGDPCDWGQIRRVKEITTSHSKLDTHPETIAIIRVDSITSDSFSYHCNNCLTRCDPPTTVTRTLEDTLITATQASASSDMFVRYTREE